MMKKILVIVFITSQSFSQDCDVDISDSIRTILIENIGKQNFQHEIDAIDLFITQVYLLNAFSNKMVQVQF